MNTLKLTRQSPTGRGAIHRTKNQTLNPVCGVIEHEVIKRYRHIVLHEAPTLEPKVNATWAKDLARLTAGFRPECADALHEVYLQCFPVTD